MPSNHVFRPSVTVPPFLNQQHSATCSLAVLRMVLAFNCCHVTEANLVKEVTPDYGLEFQNLWNPTIAKLALSYGLNVTMYARWPLFKKPT